MPPPLFILAPGRSFTSITCGIIGCHPEMYGLPEINLFGADTVGSLLKLYQRHNVMRRTLDHGLLRTLAELAFSEQTEETIEAARVFLSENEDMRTDELFQDLTEWADGRGLVDKSPFNVHMPTSLDRIRQTLPEAHFLHLTRHPGNTVSSGYKSRSDIKEKALKRFPNLAPIVGDKFDQMFLPQSAFRGSYDDAPDRAWLKPHLTILRFLENVPAEQQMRIRGEDLLSDPPKCLVAIAEWLGIGSSPADLEAMLHPETSPYAAYGPSSARFGNDPNFLEHPELRPWKYKPRPLEWETPEGKVLPLPTPVRELAMEFGY